MYDELPKWTDDEIEQERKKYYKNITKLLLFTAIAVTIIIIFLLLTTTITQPKEYDWVVRDVNLLKECGHELLPNLFLNKQFTSISEGGTIFCYYDNEQKECFKLLNKNKEGNYYEEGTKCYERC